MRRAVVILTLALLAGAQFGSAPSAVAQEVQVPRTILALYDSADSPTIRMGLIHRLAEMPLNHLGLLVEYWTFRTACRTRRNMTAYAAS